MLLHTLLRKFNSSASLSGVDNVEITGIQEDSRRIVAGNLFVARAGEKTDGVLHVPDAIRRGAAAILAESRLESCTAPQVVLKDVDRAMSALANIFHRDPSHEVKVLGITGTNGKTTSAYLIRHLLAKVNQRCGMIGTVEIDDGQTRREADMTTPSAIEVAETLAAMRAHDCLKCAMEVSSHALDQWRVAGIRFAGAAFSNLSGDHLDYHKTMTAYADAKARLFESLDEGAVAVVNGDDPASARMVRDSRARIIRFSVSREADYQARDIRITLQGSSFILVSPDGRAEVNMPLVGRHNIENVLLSAALVGETFGLSVHQIAAGLRDAMGAPGRLQSVRCGQPFTVLVDYAHTDDALENVLSALQKLPHNKLRVVFGCGGDRDATKRPRMARIAQQYADAIYVTSDNPRREDPQSILDQICAGFSAEPGGRVVVDIDRRSAIRRAIGDAAEGDVVLLAGKGHEDYQIIGSQKHPFDDAAEAAKALRHAPSPSGNLGNRA